MKDDIQKKINEKKKIIEKETKELKSLEEKQRQESEKDIWLEIPERGIAITTKLQFKGKTYPDILKEVDESHIADYDLLQGLRNEGFKSNWEKYGFLKDFSAFVPNKDEVSKASGYVAYFYTYSWYAYLGSGGYSSSADSGRGVFLIKKIAKKK
jgi:hypothetical protein